MPIGFLWQTFLETPLVNFMVILTIVSFGSYGAAILLFTVITRLVTFPLTMRTMRSTKAMQAIQPHAVPLPRPGRERQCRARRGRLCRHVAPATHLDRSQRRIHRPAATDEPDDAVDDAGHVRVVRDRRPRRPRSLLGGHHRHRHHPALGLHRPGQLHLGLADPTAGACQDHACNCRRFPSDPPADHRSRGGHNRNED